MEHSRTKLSMFAIGTVVCLIMVSTVVVMPSDEIDAATDLGTFSDISMPGGSETEYYTSVDITDEGMPAINANKTIYVLAGSPISIHCNDGDVNWITYGSPNTWLYDERTSTSLKMSLGSGDSCYIALMLTGGAHEADLMFVGVSPHQGNNSFTDVGNWCFPGSDQSSDSELYTSMVFCVENIGGFGNEGERIQYTTNVALGTVVNIFPSSDFITAAPRAPSEDFGLSREGFALTGVIDKVGTYKIELDCDYTDGVTITLNVVQVLTSHTVTFDSRGGSEVPTQSIEDGGYALAPEDPVLYGFIFRVGSPTMSHSRTNGISRTP